MNRRECSVDLSNDWYGLGRGYVPVMMKEEANEPATPPLVGLSPEFLIELFRYHMGWLGRVAGLNEAEAKRRVMNLLKAGRIGYQDEAGNKRTLPGETIVWMYRQV